MKRFAAVKALVGTSLSFGYNFDVNFRACSVFDTVSP